VSDTLFELSLLGGAVERRYRRLRPDVEELPWKTLDARAMRPALVERARRFWTISAFTEHRAAAAAAATVDALIVARAPLDLIAVASQFVIEELAHVEISARIATALGGGVPLVHDPRALVERPDPALAPLVRAAELVVRVYCVAESYSLAMLSPGRDGGHPLLRAALARIKKDEAAHGRFGWIFLDWADEQLDAAARAHLERVAAECVAQLEQRIARPVPERDETFGWVPRDFHARARRALNEEIRAPLAARGLI
jgi:hypothetical protein